ncbi:MAG: thioredoxin domain-containing protein [Planctomycetales bacterium]|nr:thioredoxin domain-containing protein [Planctomycetales bacterium]
MSNRLAGSSSPYLLQHKDNPVDWYPWCDEAFAIAREQDKPIFLSVGYSACHWCHVMEHESFENERLAGMLNEHFVPIKVDREERPDVDQIYMQAVQMLTGSGGWPMSVFMSPDGRPFYGGTYWPPEDRWGRPGFGQVLTAVAEAWRTKRAQIYSQAEQIAEHIQSACHGPDSLTGELDPQWLSAAEDWLLRHFDRQHGGFGGAPKFPHAMDLSLLLEGAATAAGRGHDQSDTEHQARRLAVEHTLHKMANGGIYDHLGGGFARYSVDDRWLVPHFEKMLYDNALLAVTYADAYRLWRTERYADVVRETLDYVLRDMTNPLGAFFSAEDADSEGIEGKFYVWTVAEICQVLGDQRGQRFCKIYDATPNGNFEGQCILNLAQPLSHYADNLAVTEEWLRQELLADRRQLFEHRQRRVRPGLDDKVLLSWNALMITAMLRGYRALGEPGYLAAANRCVDFIRSQMLRQDFQLWHTWRAGHASLNAYLDDYAYFIDALCELFQVEPSTATLELANGLAQTLIHRFAAPAGGFYFTADDHEKLIARTRDVADSSVPSGNSMAASALISLGRLTGNEALIQAGLSALRATSGVMSASPQAAGQSLRVLRRLTEEARELVLLGAQSADWSALQRDFLFQLDPTAMVIALPESEASAQLQAICPLLANRKSIDNQVTLYICQDGACSQPVVGDNARSMIMFPKPATG